jgi:hypothetical protein
MRLQHEALQPLGRPACPCPKCRGLDVDLPRCRTPRSLRRPPVRDFIEAGWGCGQGGLRTESERAREQEPRESGRERARARGGGEAGGERERGRGRGRGRERGRGRGREGQQRWTPWSKSQVKHRAHEPSQPIWQPIWQRGLQHKTAHKMFTTTTLDPDTHARAPSLTHTTAHMQAASSEAHVRGLRAGTEFRNGVRQRRHRGSTLRVVSRAMERRRSLEVYFHLRRSASEGHIIRTRRGAIAFLDLDPHRRAHGPPQHLPNGLCIQRRHILVVHRYLQFDASPRRRKIHAETEVSDARACGRAERNALILI